MNQMKTETSNREYKIKEQVYKNWGNRSIQWMLLRIHLGTTLFFDRVKAQKCQKNTVQVKCKKSRYSYIIHSKQKYSCMKQWLNKSNFLIKHHAIVLILRGKLKK